MFYPESARENYLFDTSGALTFSEMNKVATTGKRRSAVTFHLPIDLDSEFQSWHEKYSSLLSEHNLASLTLTVQAKPVHATESRVFCHPDLERLGFQTNYPVFQSGFAVVDLLVSHGIPARIEKVGDSVECRERYKLAIKTRKLKVWIYAHFAVADVLRMATGSLHESLVTLCHDKIRGTKIVQDRRLKAKIDKGFGRDFVHTNHLIYIGNVPYALELVVIDSVAVHGEGSRSLVALAGNVGVSLEEKGNFTKDDKALMLDQYLNRPKDFDAYARGDLAVYKCLEQNSSKFRTVYKKLGVEQYFDHPSPTIGATISRLMESRIFDRFGIEPNDRKAKKTILETYCQPASPDHLARFQNSYLGLLGKVVGARAFNNRPTVVKLEGSVFDTDLAGAYARSMLVQDYPLGRPFTYEKPKDCKTVKSLRQFLTDNEGELVDGLFVILFDLEGQLSEDQDFFHSWKPPSKRLDHLDYCDFYALYDKEGEKSWLDDQDETKIYSREIKHSLLTSDSLEWLKKIATPTFRNTILDRSNVLAAMWYPKSQRVNTIDELVQAYQDEPDDYDQRPDYRKGSVKTDDRRCRKWFGLSLGDLLIDQLLSEREKYDKRSRDPQVRAMNALFKLCCNTTFGVTGSRYFKVSNTVVGNNITARVRVAIWCVEKALRCQQSITDGGQGDLNRVAFPRPRQTLNQRNTVATDRNHRAIGKEITYKPLGGFDQIIWSNDGENLEFWKNGEVESLSEKPALKKIDALILEHCKNNFPLKVFDFFKFETKGVVKKAVFHGLTNYLFEGGWHEKYKGDYREMIAMRSYSKNPNEAPGLFLKSIGQNPNRVPRQKSYAINQILKVNEFRERFKTYRKKVLQPGDSYQKLKWIHEFSPSQFLYQTREQRQKWVALITASVAKYGQSIESHFINRDGSIDLENMVVAIDNLISRGFNRPIKKIVTNHPHFDEYNSEAEKLDRRFLRVDNQIPDTFDYSNISREELQEKLEELLDW